jgi:hypothetical protein
MPTLHDRFTDLAEDAPAGPTPAGIWVEGRRRARSRRVGTALIATVALVALVGVGGLAVHRAQAPTYAGQSGTAPALPTVLHDPSGWLPVDDKPPGQLSMVVPSHRLHLIGYSWGVVGVSATTGAFGFLDLPDYAGSGPLSPDGMHVVYDTGSGPRHHQVLDGIAVYDTVTGQVDSWRPQAGSHLDVEDVAWESNDTLTFRVHAHGHAQAYEWRFGYGAPRPLRVTLGPLAGTAGSAGLYGAGAHRYQYLGGPDGPSTVVRLEGQGSRAPARVSVSESGHRVAAAHLGNHRSQLYVGRTAPEGRPTFLHAVHADLHWPWIVGWSDERHLVVVDQVSPRDRPGEGDNEGQFALTRVDVRTGRIQRITALGSHWGPSVDYAASLLGGSPRDFPPPPEPWGLRIEFGLVAGVLLVAGSGLVLWRRRARP